MALKKTNFDINVIKEIVTETIKKVPLIDLSKDPEIEIDSKKMIFDIKVCIKKDNYGIYTCLSEVQDLVYYELKELFDENQITVNVGTLDI